MWEPVNDPVNGAVSDVNCVDEDIVFVGNADTICVLLLTIPDGSSGVTCVDDDTIPTGIPVNPVYETCPELDTNVGTLVNPVNGNVPVNEPENDPVNAAVSDVN